MRVNIIGNQMGEGMPVHLALLLDRYGIDADINSLSLCEYDVQIVMGLWHLNKAFNRHYMKEVPPTIAYSAGSDIWEATDEELERIARDLIAYNCFCLYSHPDQQKKTGVKGIFWHLPIDTHNFNPLKCISYEPEKLDTLFYAPRPATYHLDKVFEEIEANPNKKYTLLGRGAQDLAMILPDNVNSIRYCPYQLMPKLFKRHRIYKSYVSTRQADYPSKMCYEALLMGCEASYMGENKISDIPDYMRDYNAMPRLVKWIKQITK